MPEDARQLPEANEESRDPRIDQDRSREAQMRMLRALRRRAPAMLAALLVLVGINSLWKYGQNSLGPHYELGYELTYIVGGIAIICFLYNLVSFQLSTLGVSESPSFRDRKSRVGLALVFMFLGLRAGNYVHLCLAGSRLIEGAAMLGTPLAAGLLVYSVRRRAVGVVVAVILITLVWLMRRPYLDWVHGN